MSTKEVLPYATPDHRPSYVGAAVLCLTGLGLIALGGCFLIGILILIDSSRFSPTPWTARHYILLNVLYTLCFACVAGAVTVLFLGIKRALR